MDRVRQDGRKGGSAEESKDGTDGEVNSESDSDGGSGGESAGESVGDMRRFWSRKSSLYNHLVASPDGCNSYYDSSLTVLCRGRYGYGLYLKAFEAITFILSASVQIITKPNAGILQYCT